MIVHYPKINKLLKKNKINIKNIPIIVYCYKESCNASELLINKLVELGFTNLREYPHGIVGWNN